MSFKAAPFCMHVQAAKVNKLLNAKHDDCMSKQIANKK